MTDEFEPFDGFSGPATDFEDGSLHPATLTKLTRKTLTGPYGTSPAIIWTFATEDGGTIDGTTSEATGPASKARPWLEALVGKARVTEMVQKRITPTELLGRECQVLIEINDAGYPRVKSVLPRNTPQGTVKVETSQDLDELPF